MIKKHSKKILLLIFLFTLVFSVAPSSLYAQGTTPLLEPSIFGGNNEEISLDKYISGVFNLAISVAVILAVVMLVVAGVEYTASSIPGAKEDAKNRIFAAIFGLLIALASVLIVQTILGGGTVTVPGFGNNTPSNLSNDPDDLGPTPDNPHNLDEGEVRYVCNLASSTNTVDCLCDPDELQPDPSIYLGESEEICGAIVPYDRGDPRRDEGYGVGDACVSTGVCKMLGTNITCPRTGSLEYDLLRITSNAITHEGKHLSKTACEDARADF